jgi:Phage tail assembly chaperone protein
MSLMALVDSQNLAVYYYYYTSGGIPADVNDHCVRVPVPQGLDYTVTKAVKNQDGTISIVNDPDKLSAKLWAQVREERNRLLTACDWTQLPDAPVADRTKWVTYRSQLRQVPETQTDPANIVWPTPPS